MFVADAITVAGNAQGRHAFHETGGQTTQAAIAQGCIGFEQADALDVQAQFGHGFAGDFQQPQVAQAVIQKATDQKFQRQVINAFLDLAVDLPGVVHPVLDHMVAGGQGDGFEPVMLECMVRVLAHRISEFGKNSGAKSSHFSVTNKGFLRHRYDLK